jgi:small subunit ribosomal protein S1
LYAEFAAALEKYDFRFRVGEKVTGTVLMTQNKGIYVDIGAKSAAFCPVAECGMGKVARVSPALERSRVTNPNPPAKTDL